MKFILICIFFGFSIVINNAKFHFRMVKIECSSSKVTIPTRPSCFIKTYQRQSFLTVCTNITRKLPNAKIDYYQYRKNSDGYQKIIEFKNMEICKMIMNTDSTSVPLMKSLIDHIRKMSKGNFLDGCDLIGESCMYNFTVANFTLMELYPEGDYMTNILYYDQVDSNIFNLSLYSRISK